MRFYQPYGDNQRADMPFHKQSETRVNHPGFPTPETGTDHFAIIIIIKLLGTVLLTFP